jgi:amino acid transporter
MSKAESVPRLKRGVVGTLEAVGQEIAAMAPACDTVAFITSAAAFAFVLTPLAFLIAMLTMYLEVNTLYHLSRRHASAGGYYGYISTAFNPIPAAVSGFLYVLYQVASTAAIPVYVAGVVLPGVLKYFFGITLPGWVWIPFILTFIIVPILLAMVGIRPQMKYIRYAALGEVAFLGITALIIILKIPHNTLQVFNPFAWPQFASLFAPNGGAIGSLGLGMIFGITSFIGYGGSAPLGEEAKSSKSITKALIFGVLIVGIVLVEEAYVSVVGWPGGLTPAGMESFVNNPIPGIVVYSTYLTLAGGFILALFAFNSAFSDSVAMQSNAGRVYFAMARDGLLPKSFSEVHPKYVTPIKSLAFIAITASIFSIVGGFTIAYFAGVSPSQMLTLPATSPQVYGALSDAFDFLTTIALVGLVVTHLMLNTAVITLYRKLKERHYGFNLILHPLQHYVLPAIATGIFIYVLYASIWPPVYPVTQAVIFTFVYIGIMLAYTLNVWKKRPDILKKAGRRVNIVEEELQEAARKNNDSKK